MESIHGISSSAAIQQRGHMHHPSRALRAVRSRRRGGERKEKRRRKTDTTSDEKKSSPITEMVAGRSSTAGEPG
jgi:hypothetical protein